MNVQHVGGGEHSILLGCEVEEEACWRLSSESAWLEGIRIAI